MKLQKRPRKGDSNGTTEKEAHGGVQGAGGAGGGEGRQDGERAGQPALRPPDPDPRLEEAAARRRRGRLQPGRQAGSQRRRGGPGRVVRADRAAEDGAGMAQKKMPESA